MAKKKADPGPFGGRSGPGRRYAEGVTPSGVRASAPYRMQVVPTDPSPVAGTHGRHPSSPEHGPVLLCSDASLARDDWALADVKDLVLAAAGLVEG